MREFNNINLQNDFDKNIFEEGNFYLLIKENDYSKTLFAQKGEKQKKYNYPKQGITLIEDIDKLFLHNKIAGVGKNILDLKNKINKLKKEWDNNMRKKIKDYFKTLKNGEFRPGVYIKKVGTKYIHIYTEWDLSSSQKIEIEEFYTKYRRNMNNEFLIIHNCGHKKWIKYENRSRDYIMADIQILQLSACNKCKVARKEVV
jgi:hypothetical protein